MSIHRFDHHVKLRSKFLTEGQNSYSFGQNGKDVKAELETFIFIPRTLGINHKTYQPSQFYEDLKSAFLLKLAPTSLSGLSGRISPPNHRLDEAAQALKENQDDKHLQALETRHRLFGRLASETVTAFLDDARLQLRRQRDPSCVDYFLEHAPALSRRYRELYHPELAEVEGYVTIFACNDEHLSLILEQASYQLADLLSRHGPDGQVEQIDELMRFAQSEAAYREQRGYPQVNSSKRNYEDLVYRIGTLENHMKSALYLSARNKPDSAITRELILSAAAGIAMIFATAVAFVAHVQYENWTTTFFIILVISYMFKDRIKAQTQSYLTQKGRRFFYDFKTSIYGLASSRAIGHKRETMRFIKQSDLDPEIMLRRHHSDNRFASISASDETVLCYKRQLHFNKSRLTDSYAGFAVDGVTNVSGFDFTRLTQKMDDAKCTVYAPEGKPGSRIQGRRVYHLHVILRRTEKDRTETLHYRLIINRSGIRRLETY